MSRSNRSRRRTGAPSRSEQAETPTSPGGPNARVSLPLTSALLRVGVRALSMGTPGHRIGRLFGVWEGQTVPADVEGTTAFRAASRERRKE
jgi:hypothetical protein